MEGDSVSGGGAVVGRSRNSYKRAKSNESNDLCFHHQYFNEMVDLDLVFILSLIISGIFLKTNQDHLAFSKFLRENSNGKSSNIASR